MSILFSGDFHANARGELDLITKDSLIDKYGQKIYDSINYHIILGDGGFMWQNNEEKDKHNYKILGKRSFPVLCVLGNHEPIYGMKNVPEEDIGLGETVYKIKAKPFVAYLKRGKVYVIDGIKFLVLGGALSIDKNRRIPNKSWWENEYWDEREKEYLYKLLETENSFDCVISHIGPHHINQKLFLLGGASMAFLSHPKFKDEVAFLNDEIHKSIKFKEWWSGHWHEDKYHYNKSTKRKYQYLYRTTKILNKTDGKLAVYNEYGKAKR
ncbi:MAG: metallophosphoesterase [Treponema sp.]|jgi:3-oxoacid CoA-transferase subunit A|nr:metallophosphoesterase [Treponema sp.]